MNDNGIQTQKFPVPMRRKSAARMAAVQFNFQRLFVEAELEVNIADFLKYYASDVAKEMQVREIDISYFNQLVFSCEKNRLILEELISSSLDTGWSIDRLSKADFAILLVAICELRHILKTPAKVIITEYVSITNAYNGDTGFVNAILDKNAKTLRSDEIFY